jgi:hypothetical protein
VTEHKSRIKTGISCIKTIGDLDRVLVTFVMCLGMWLQTHGSQARRSALPGSGSVDTVSKGVYGGFGFDL